MNIGTEYLERCIRKLELAYAELQRRQPDDIAYQVCSDMAVRQFEIVLKQSGVLLRKRIRPYVASNREADRLYFKDVFRHAAKHGLLSVDACQRWLEYRDNDGDAANPADAGHLESTLALLPRFIPDAKALAHVIAHGAEERRLDLPARYRRQIEALVRRHLPGVEVWAYGSRVNGQSHAASDLDLVLRGPDLEPLPLTPYAELIEALRESNIPILIQAHDWARLPKAFHREIERDYVVVASGLSSNPARAGD